MIIDTMTTLYITDINNLKIIIVYALNTNLFILTITGYIL